MRKLLLAALLLALAVVPASASDPRETVNAADAFVNGAIVVKGEGASSDGPFTLAQKRIMALRAAKLAALREAAELLDGVRVTGETTVQNAAATSDSVRTAAESIIRGSTVVKEEYDPATGAAIIYISVPMRGAASALMPSVSSLVADEPRYRPEIIASTAGYDGVIIDARGKSLKPALVNRILSKNGVIYDPSKVSQKVLAENGAAMYTNDVQKAKVLLANRGSMKPLVVKAENSERSTDAVLGPIEAGAVFYSNQMTKFLDEARVVFVLD